MKTRNLLLALSVSGMILGNSVPLMAEEVTAPTTEQKEFVDVGDDILQFKNEKDLLRLVPFQTGKIEWENPVVLGVELKCTVTFDSSDPDIVSVRDGNTFTAHKAGEAVLWINMQIDPESMQELKEKYPDKDFGQKDIARGLAVRVGYDTYRLYNPNSGEHFFTQNSAEKDNLVNEGWKYEGIAWASPYTSSTPVYRLYNPNAGDHHYTTDKNEVEYLVKAGWRDEGICWYSDDEKEMAVLRTYNPNAIAGAHHFTTSSYEISCLTDAGWKSEEVGWYGLPSWVQYNIDNPIGL